MRFWPLIVIFLPHAHAVGSDHLDVQALSDMGMLHAHQYLDELQERAGHKLSKERAESLFKPMIDGLYRSLNDARSETSKPAERVKLIRQFVKQVGPLLGKDDHVEDGPLHVVLQRANDIIGIVVGGEQKLATRSAWRHWRAGVVEARMLGAVTRPLRAAGAPRRVLTRTQEKPEGEEKLHPHVEARRIVSGMRLFMSTVMKAHEQQQLHDEL